jgi:hypothetical protein
MHWDAAALWTPKIARKKRNIMTMSAWRNFDQYHKDNTWKLGQQKQMFVRFIHGNTTSKSDIFNLKLLDIPAKISEIQVDRVPVLEFGLMFSFVLFLLCILTCNCILQRRKHYGKVAPKIESPVKLSVLAKREKPISKMIASVVDVTIEPKVDQTEINLIT